MHIQTIIFQRQKGGAKEKGLLINEGDGPILDKTGQNVGEIWNYRRTFDLVLTIPLEEETPDELT